MCPLFVCRLGPQWPSTALLSAGQSDCWRQRKTPSASTHLGRLTYGQEVAGSTVVHLEPLDGDLAVESHWVVMSFLSIRLIAAGVVVALILGIIVFLVFKGRD